MLTTLLFVAILPLTLLTTVLLVVGRVQGARDRRIARQIAVTDAIDRELGVIVAPLVRRRFGGGWRVEVPVPFESPAVVGSVVTIAHAVLSPSRVEVLLTAQARENPRTNVRRLQPTETAPRAARQLEVEACTGTTTSRAS